MLNPDNIPIEWGIPIALILCIILLIMEIQTRRKLNRALQERPVLKVYDNKTKSWKPVKNIPQDIYDQDADPANKEAVNQ